MSWRVNALCLCIWCIGLCFLPFSRNEADQLNFVDYKLNENLVLIYGAIRCTKYEKLTGFSYVLKKKRKSVITAIQLVTHDVEGVNF